MRKHKLKRGYDIRLVGEAQKQVDKADLSQLYAIQPPDFNGVAPRLELEQGAKVKIGSTLFIDKKNPRLKFASPASGELVQINRGERRTVKRL
jgi:Na+-transporting NADH:ubiquinone oxidoreductase subunit A